MTTGKEISKKESQSNHFSFAFMDKHCINCKVRFFFFYLGNISGLDLVKGSERF